MAHKYEDAFQLMRSTAGDIVKTPEQWKAFLGTAAMNYKRPFHNQLLIYCQKPEATACATFDFWNKKAGRLIKKGSKGIVTIDPASQGKEILFDVSDTVSQTNGVLPIWSVTEEMHAPLGLTLQEHFETAVSSGDLAAVLFEIGEKAACAIVKETAASVDGCKEGSLMQELRLTAIEDAVRETLIDSVQYMLLKRCGLDPEEQYKSFDFLHVGFFSTPETISALGSAFNAVTKDLFKDISLSARSIEKILSLSENKAKEAEQHGTDLHTTGGLPGTERLSAETGNDLREIRDHAPDVLDEREGGRVHSSDDDGDAKSTPDGNAREGDETGKQLGSGDGSEGGRDRVAEEDRSDEVGRPDEQLPDGGRGDRAGRDDLHLTGSPSATSNTADVVAEVADDVLVNKDDDSTEISGGKGKRPDLSLEYVLENVLRHHKHLNVTGAEIQNYFIDNEDNEERTAYIFGAYNKEYTELIIPEDGYRVGYHADMEGLEVWIGAYLGSNSRVVVPWNVVVGAIDVLIANDQYLSLSERVELPTEEEQVLLVSEWPDVPLVENLFAIPQQIIDEVICSGSNSVGSIYTICGFYKRGHSSEENVKFLAEHYGEKTGKGFIIDGRHYSAVFEADGIRLAEGKGVYAAEESVLLPWKAVDQRIKELLSLGRYMSTADYSLVEDHLLSKAAEEVWYTHREVLSKDLVAQLGLTAYRDLPLVFERHNYSADTEALKKILQDPSAAKALAEETLVLLDACKGKEPMLRVRGYQLAHLGRVYSLASDLSRDITEYPPEKAFEPSYKTFITDDEVDFDLKQGSRVEDGKYRIFLYFNEPHTAAEKAEFLKNEYGNGGGNGALGGVFNAHDNHDSKGLVLSKGNPTKPYDTVTLSWTAVTKRIEKLIGEGRYLSEQEVKNLPNFEKNLIAREVCGFFSNLPLDFERLYSIGLDREDAISHVAEKLADSAFMEKTLATMHAYLREAPEDIRDRTYKETCLKDVERFASGVSLFDFEARKGEWEYRDQETITAPPGGSRAAENKNIIAEGNAPAAAPDVQYTYVPEVGDRIVLDGNSFEVVHTLRDGEVVINDVNFPLLTESYAQKEFVQRVLEDPANKHLWAQITSEHEITSAVEPDVEEGIVSAESSGTPSEKVYRYYSQLRHLEDGYPSPEANEPLAVVPFGESTYIDDFGISAWGYLEYAAPLAHADVSKFDLMLYEPPIVSNDGKRKYQLGFGSLGNGTTVWNRLELDGRDYRTVAHISDSGKITYYDKTMPQAAMDEIKKMALAAEALHEVEAAYAQPVKPKINRKIMACRNYTAFKKFAEDILSGKYQYMRFESEGYEPLYVERIGENLIAMAHTYVQNGDLMYDPEMVFSFDNEKEELQAHSYELSSAGLYQRVSDDQGNVNIGLQRELNSFLNTWLKNVLEQEQPLVRVVDREGNELVFMADKNEVPSEVAPAPQIAPQGAPDARPLGNSTEVSDAVDLDVENEPQVSAIKNPIVPEKGLASGEKFEVGATLVYQDKYYKVINIEGTDKDDIVALEEVNNPGHYYTDVYGFLEHIWELEIAGDYDAGFDDRYTSINANGEIKHGSYNFNFDEYLTIKDLYPDDLVAYQVGDFYEFLGEDAEKVSKELGLTIAFRDVGLSEKLPLCGIPAHVFAQDCNLLIQNGYNVAVHGRDDKTGKIVTVDYETAFAPSRKDLGVGAGLPESEKLVFDVPEQPERAAAYGFSRVNRGELLDYRIEHLAHDAKSTKERFKQNVAAISLLKQLEGENRLATAEEQNVLAVYVGWGGLSDAFDENKPAWASEFAELKALLTPEEYASAKSSTLTAFYTPPEIIRFVYDTLESMGFKKGNILEPSCGVGNFIGMLPESLSDSKVYGVELDPISGRIAQQLYQKQDIRVQGFEKTDFPDSFFDVAIGNVPFGQFKVNDKRYNKNNFLIHDYFFAKALDKVRPGGVVAFITSKGTMDKENIAVRKYLADRAEFLGAVRLPDNAFKANAGTEVTSDIIFLQKRDRAIDIDPYTEGWIDLSYLRDPETGFRMEDPNGELMEINTYFVLHPEHVLGEMKVESTQYGYDTACKAIPGVSVSEQLKRIHIASHRDLSERDADESESNISSIPADPDVRNFSYTLVDNVVYFRENSQMYPMSFVNEDMENRVKALIVLRDTVRRLIEMQAEDYSEAAIIKQRETLNSLYDSFAKKYGLINERKNQKAFESDSSYYLLASLENLDEEGKLKSKADIFHKRTVRPHVAVTSVDTAAEALEVSISEKACVDIPYMMQLSGKTADALEQDLVGVIFRVPYRANEDGSPVFVPADEYLSGNVRQKLKEAKAAADGDELFTANVSALEMVQPKDLDASEISLRLGSTWISPEYIKQFVFELLETPQWMRGDSSYCMDVLFSPVTGEWFIENKNRDNYNVKANTTYGTERASAYKIIEDTLNLRDARVYDYVEDEYGRKKAVLNREETSIAQQKQEMIKEAFVEWVWQDPDRREFLTRYYNEHFNCIRPREYDGSHLTFPGMSSEITLQKHQLNAIARVLYGGNTLLAHAVGAGKTFEMVAAAQESKRLGLCNKSMFVVPNHLIEQFAGDYMRLYPNANVLCSTKKDFEPANRKKFCGRIATGDWDAVIIGHSQFEKIPMSTDGQRRALQEQLDDIERGIIKIKEESNERFSVKQLEKTKKNIEVKLERLNDDSRKDDVVTFEELGVDRLFVDEAHYYKNLFLYTKMRNVAGIGSREAQKSSDLFMKCRYLDKLTGNRGVIFATGTPISNSMTELYTMQRYLQYDMLCDTGMQHFDSWASTFGETVTAIELAPEGTGYRAKTRFARFNNLPELMATFKEMADVQTADMLHLPVPKANFHTVALPPSEIQKEMVQGLADRAKAIHDKKVSPNEDNMLLVTNDGRKLALDQRLIDPLFGDHPKSKVNACADNVFRIYQEGAAEKATQLVFCDLSTPKSDGFDVYNDLKDKLVSMGIPDNQIAFIHNYKTEVQKKRLFEDVRKGKVRILMGSTQKMGTGTNVQDLLKALHDLDCPWRPSDLEQRLGRGVRQGNTNDEIDIYRYVQKDTFDAYLYQLIENKQSFISQIMTSKSLARSAEDVDEAVLSYAEIKSLATGDPRIKEKMDLDISVKRLKLLKQSYLREKYSLEDKVLKTFPKDIAYYTDAIAKCKRDNELLRQNSSTDKEYFFPMVVDGTVFTEKGDAGAAIIEACRNRKRLAEETPIGEYRGFKLSVVYDVLKQNYELILRNELRYIVPLGPDKFGNITRINNLLDSLPARLQAFEDKLTNTHTQLENAKKQLEKPFAHEQELKEKSARLDQLNVELSLDKDAAIDIASSLDEKEQSTAVKSGSSRNEER